VLEPRAVAGVEDEAVAEEDWGAAEAAVRQPLDGSHGDGHGDGSQGEEEHGRGHGQRWAGT
jgi:hypothetical protein